MLIYNFLLPLYYEAIIEIVITDIGGYELSTFNEFLHKDEVARHIFVLLIFIKAVLYLFIIDAQSF